MRPMQQITVRIATSNALVSLFDGARGIDTVAHSSCVQPHNTRSARYVAFGRWRGGAVVDNGAVTAELMNWDKIADLGWPTLLLGNGLSINVSDRFNYDALFDKAKLTPAAEAVFDDLDTENFEVVLEAVHHATVVLEPSARTHAT